MSPHSLRLHAVLAALLFLLPVRFLAAAESQAPAARAGRPTLFVCGDSTAARNQLPIEGWGEELATYFDGTRLRVENRARGGRSARTFIGEGLWAAVDQQLRPGDVVLIQFGHNDTKSALSSERYDGSGIGPEVEVIKDRTTGASIEIHTFGYYLREMITRAKQAGATVVVLSPVPRNKWADGKIVRGEEEHGRWAAEVARAEQVPFVDVNALIADRYDPIGRVRLKALYFPQDNTHTNPAGAKVNAAAVVVGLAALDLPSLAGALKPGAVTAANAVLASVSSAAAAVRLALPLGTAFPARQAGNVNPDTPLRLTFASPPRLGKSGRIRIIDQATQREVETIDVSTPVATQTIGGEPNYRYYPVILSGSEAAIYPRHGALSYHATYQVLVDEGVFEEGADRYAAVTAEDGWTFTTKAAPPAAGSTRLTVAADGSGDFNTVQGALDFIPEGNTTPTTIFLRRGTYQEIVFFTNKHALTLQGEDRAQTVIAYATNNQFNPTTGNPFGDQHPDPSTAKRGGNIYHRGVFLAHRVNDLVLANLTIRNLTPQGGSQAEAIILNGTTSARAILKDVDLYSYQDTLQINGQAYLNGCYIEGDIDFMWGTGPCFFDRCTCRSLRSGAYYTQIRNPGTNHGYVYVDCRFDGIQGVMGNYLSRIGTGRFPQSEVVLLDCTLTSAVSPVAWMFLGGAEGSESNAAEAHFWEFNSRDPAGRPVDMTFRLPGSKRLREPADAATIANYRDPRFVLGGDWDPKAASIFSAPIIAPATTPTATAPRIVQPPVDQLALLGTTPSLTVVAEAAPGGRLAYKWHQDGRPLPGATGPTLRIPHVGWDDAGAYTVTVSNAAGSVTSASARVTPVAPQSTAAPDLPRIPEPVFDVTAFGAVADGVTDNTRAFQQAIDTAVAAGGGIVSVPPGAKPYLSGPLTLGSHLALELLAGATLQLLPYSAQPAPGAYPLVNGAYPNFLAANGAHDIAIVGNGTINGDGEAWWAAFKADRKMPHRPFLVRFGKCERVLISGVTFTRSPMFHVAISADHLTIVGITIRTPEAPNTDGLDPAGRHHLIQNCAISCGDDNLVMKPGGTFCQDITIADCAFGEGHGLSVGGQTDRGLDGMTVKNCTFDGTTSGLRLKADPTEGGDVKNITYTNLTMQRVNYPIVFYSYYRNVGNPASVSGGNKTTVEKVHAWNAKPPQSLATKTMPAWRNLTVTNLLSAETRGYSIIWGLPRSGYLIENVKLANVRIVGGPGLEVFDATDVQFTGSTSVSAVVAANALVITRQPTAQVVAPQGTATFSVGVIGPATTSSAALNYTWTCNGRTLEDGRRGDGTQISGSRTPTLTLSGVTVAAAGKYAVAVSTLLDGYEPAREALVPNQLPVSATSSHATLTVKADQGKERL